MLKKAVVRGGVIGLVLAGSGSVAFAANRGSIEDQMACTQDVYRYCSNFIPDEDAIVGCLKHNLRGLSPACHQVFTRPDSPAGPPSGDQESD